MGHDQQTASDIEADAFFAQFINPTADLIAKVRAEQDGDLAAIVAEDKAFGYWERKMAARAIRRAARQRITAAEHIAAAARVAHIDDTARLAPLPTESLALLPPTRLVRLTDAERRATASYWRRLTNPDTAAALTRKIARDAWHAADRARRAEIAAHREAAAWRLEQRAFERAQWLDVLAMQADRRRRKIDNQWTAISEQRAMEIALAVLAKHTPPQDRT